MNKYPLDNPKPTYRGRFAPSPSGDLHFGSLIAAVASYLDARSHDGEWLVRIEDIDETRTVKGSADSILTTLEQFGFEWQGDVVTQSERKTLYQDYLDELIHQQLIYACDCSRSKIKQYLAQTNSHAYPGFCKHNPVKLPGSHALRCRVTEQTLSFQDAIQGNLSVNLQQDCGDFIVKRRDGFFAYQLVVVVDDAEQNITNIVRGADLLNTTPVQRYLQLNLALAQPEYAHHPVAMQPDGQKLSKSHQSIPLSSQQAAASLYQAMCFLNMSPPEDLKTSSIEDFWQWAISAWDRGQIPSKKEIAFTAFSDL